MKKFSVTGVAILAGLAVMAEATQAQEAQRPRRKSFFETLFGVRTKPRRETFNNRQWWEDDPGEIRIIRPGRQKTEKQRKKQNLAVAVARKPVKKVAAVPQAFIDPEVSEGFGMGNMVYALPKQQLLYDASFRNLITIDKEASAIRAVLTDKSIGLKSSDNVRSAILEFYKSNGFQPIWSKSAVLNDRAIATVNQLSKAGEEGLEPLRYKPSALPSFDVTADQFENDVLGAAFFDVSLTLAAVTYAMHQSGGAFEPALLSQYHDVKPGTVSPTVAMKVLAHSPFPAEYLKSLAPTHPSYALMKAELGAMPAEDGPETIAEGKRVRIGQKDPRIATLRQILAAQGYVGQAAAEVDFDKDDVLDKTLAKALKAYQADKGLQQTSNLDAATIKALNGPDRSEQRNLLITNMERLRWLPKQLGSRYVFANQASYLMDVIDQGKLVWESNIIVGKPLTQTNVFSDTMETVVLNPSWGLPQSILLNEYLPKLRANPGHFDKIGYKVVNADGKVVPSRSINWNAVGSGSGIGVQQPPGETNALGKVKFLFPNSHSIYMHDTPNRHLFAETKRNFSHGCVRVQNPIEFASVLLNRNEAELSAEIDLGESKSIKITNPTKVHLTYFTAWPDRAGKMQYYSDPYGRDATLKQARATVAKTLGFQDGQQVSQKSQ
jgi:L,D-transpeptidase YcbB